MKVCELCDQEKEELTDHMYWGTEFFGKSAQFEMPHPICHMCAKCFVALKPYFDDIDREVDENKVGMVWALHHVHEAGLASRLDLQELTGTLEKCLREDKMASFKAIIKQLREKENNE